MCMYNVMKECTKFKLHLNKKKTSLYLSWFLNYYEAVNHEAFIQ